MFNKKIVSLLLCTFLMLIVLALSSSILESLSVFSGLPLNPIALVIGAVSIKTQSDLIAVITGFNLYEALEEKIFSFKSDKSS